MHNVETHGAPVRTSRAWGRFALHYVEMVVAMFAGMLVIGGTLRAMLIMAGTDYSMERAPVLMLVEMGCTMAIGMGVWMRVRDHGWASTVEMSLAMLVPAVTAAMLVALDAVDASAAMAAEHVAMFPLMLLVMLRRRGDYLVDGHD
jgi:hypothetical protein